MNKIICINPPKFIKAILKLFARKEKNQTDGKILKSPKRRG